MNMEKKKRGKEKGKTRFKMVKKRHYSTLKRAEEEKKMDPQLLELCDFLAETREYFTSSGCSGRIMLLGLQGTKKRDSYFHRKWHSEVSAEKVWKALQENTKGEIWFKMEPFILHIGTCSLENAGRILRVKDLSGVKRGGVIVAKKGKFLVELVGTEEIAFPMKKERKVLVEREFVDFIVKEANKKIKRNYARLKLFEKNLKKELSE